MSRHVVQSTFARLQAIPTPTLTPLRTCPQKEHAATPASRAHCGGLGATACSGRPAARGRAEVARAHTWKYTDTTRAGSGATANREGMAALREETVQGIRGQGDADACVLRPCRHAAVLLRSSSEDAAPHLTFQCNGSR